MKSRAQATMLPVILAGGAGTRLAPIARADRPKPFIPLPDGRSLLTHACQRVAQDALFAAPLLVGQAGSRFALLNHARAAGVTPAAILLEPEVRNTAMAIAIAVAHAMATQPEAILAVLPADHIIEPVEAWHRAMAQAAHASQEARKICLLAVTPDSASSEYGYMELLGAGDYFSVGRFIEKPSHAAAFLAQNATELRWAWNAGQFIAPAEIFAQALAAHAPQVWAAAQAACAAAHREWEFTVLGAAAYEAAPALSFDRTVIEKTPVIACKLDATWRDLGTRRAWESYTELGAGDYPLPQRTDRPWGHFELADATPERAEKFLTIYPGCRLSRQRHRQRSEAWEVIEGSAKVEKDEAVILLHKGDSILIEPMTWHRLANYTDNILIIKEIQCGLPDENDIERSDDDYGRI